MFNAVLLLVSSVLDPSLPLYLVVRKMDGFPDVLWIQ
jgi:hypothetical protein